MIHAVTKEIRLDAEFILRATEILAGVLCKVRDFPLIAAEKTFLTAFSNSPVSRIAFYIFRPTLHNALRLNFTYVIADLIYLYKQRYPRDLINMYARVEFNYRDVIGRRSFTAKKKDSYMIQSLFHPLCMSCGCPRRRVVHLSSRAPSSERRNFNDGLF